MRVRLAAPACVLILAVLAGCGPSIKAPPGGGGAPAPTAAVEQFLRAARAKDYQAMGWVFGTERGSVIQRDRIAEVERRMYAIANVLQHENFELGQESPLAGRGMAALNLPVVLHADGRSVTVPFVVVRGPASRWFVEKVDLEAITNPRRM